MPEPVDENMLVFIINMSLLTQEPAISSAVWGPYILEESSDSRLRECHNWAKWVHWSWTAG